MCQYIHQGTKIDFRLKKKTRREEADRLPAFHLLRREQGSNPGLLAGSELH